MRVFDEVREIDTVILMRVTAWREYPFEYTYGMVRKITAVYS